MGRWRILAAASLCGLVAAIASAQTAPPRTRGGTDDALVPGQISVSASVNVTFELAGRR